METIITVRKSDGSIKQIRREGHITESGRRLSIEASARKLGSVVLGWTLVTPELVQTRRPFVASGRQRRLQERYNSRPTRYCTTCDGPCDNSHPGY